MWMLSASSRCKWVSPSVMRGQVMAPGRFQHLFFVGRPTASLFAVVSAVPVDKGTDTLANARRGSVAGERGEQSGVGRGGGNVAGLHPHQDQPRLVTDRFLDRREM